MAKDSLYAIIIYGTTRMFVCYAVLRPVFYNDINETFLSVRLRQTTICFSY